ncbi:dipeptide/oligopeptide/nickel ABC transporter ATP-binding protein [Metabacillus sp. FJAT-52054]|uniref:Dipeptide/oligopeptide/nickel ABC transporter ATP-binding protein n=1 Tax=Metabacillus sediminis TaxID=3117746 RepID=A0ABZ2NE32_9BACI
MEILAARKISKQYNPLQKAVDGISLTVRKGECVGIVGESGSGKSTLAKCLLGLEKPEQGEIWIGENRLNSLNRKTVRAVRKDIQAVFQNPAASLNPKLKIMDSLMEPLDIQERNPFSLVPRRREGRERTAAELLNIVGISSSYLHRYPHELSGGQKQRVSIARAISIRPSLIILDEPTASLDVSIQAKILNLLKDLQESLGISYLFISHDLAAVNFMGSRTLVMKDGRIVDQFHREDLFAESRHPYTKALVNVFED